MNQYTIRHAVDSDKERICEIYAFARKFMAENGNPNQWKNNNPSREIIDNDIAAGNLYVIEEAVKNSRQRVQIIKTAEFMEYFSLRWERMPHIML